MIRSVNLIPQPRIDARRRRERARRWVMASGAYGTALVLCWMGVRAAWGGPSVAIAQELAETRTQLEDTRAAIDLLQPRLADANTTLAASRTIGDQPDFSILLGVLANLLGDETVLRSVDVVPIDPPTEQPNPAQPAAAASESDAQARLEVKAPLAYDLRIEGLGRSQSVVSEYVLRLERCGLFSRVKLLDTRKEPFHQGQAVAFRVGCVLGEADGHDISADRTLSGRRARR
jgi:hypothetical protein